LLTFSGQNLEINADSDKGCILVELLDEAGNPIPGFTKDECVPFSRDAVRGAVEWKDGRNIGELEGKPVRVTFHMRTAKLYAFRFIA
jgi:hypothetical protein